MYSNRLLRKMAAGNVRKNVKDYFIYFFTLTFSVCLFYSFNSVSTQFDSLGLEDPLNYLSFSSGMLAGFSVLVCLIMGALVVYANRFLLRRRKKEMGIYATLGMEQKDLNRLLMMETLRIGGFSLVLGLVIGIFAAQVLSLVTARLAGVGLQSYRFMVSGYAIVLSAVFYGILFLFVHWFHVRELKKMSLLELLTADRKNETVTDGKWIVPGLLAVFSVLCILGGYQVILRMAGDDVAKALAWGGLLLLTGTFFFFTAALRIGVQLMKRNRRYYYRGLNLFTVNQMSSVLRTEGRTVAMVSILLFLSLSLTMIGPGMGKYVMNGIENAAPFDGTVYYAPNPDQEHRSAEPMEDLGRGGFDIGQFSDTYEAFWVYTSPSVPLSFLTGESYPGWGQEPLLAIMGVEDYNRILALQGIGPVSLEAGEYGISYAFPPAEAGLKAFCEDPRPLKLDDRLLLLKKEGLWRHALQNRNVLVDDGMLVVPQEIAERLTKWMWYLDFNFSGGYDTLFRESWYDSAPRGFGVATRQEVLMSLASDNLLMTYLGLYLGFTFLIIAGAVLAIRQLSRSFDDGMRYGLLKKLGVSRRDMRRSLFRQLAICFGCPLLLSLLNADVAAAAVFRHFEGLRPVTAVIVAGSGIGMVITVYVLYFITTYLGSRRFLQI